MTGEGRAGRFPTPAPVIFITLHGHRRSRLYRGANTNLESSCVKYSAEGLGGAKPPSAYSEAERVKMIAGSGYGLCGAPAIALSPRADCEHTVCTSGMRPTARNSAVALA